MKKNSLLIGLVVCLYFVACQTTGTKKESNEVKLEYLENGIPKSEKGITVVNKEGWTKDQMDFQQRYCESMFENLAGQYDAIKFCMCFLDKIQYYYEPIYVREAYEDQKKWNSYCLNESSI